jgi:hypothetical protein
MDSNNVQYFPSILVLKGYQIVATYRDPGLEKYCGNPLIEALPKILTTDEAIRRLAYFPPYKESQRNEPAHLRLHLIQSTLEFFSPLGIHIDLEQKFSRMIRMGLQARNPLLPGFWVGVNQQVQSIDPNGFVPRRQRSMAKSLTIIGVSGVGKSTAVEEILLTYPQVINHNHYHDQNFTFKQIVWLKLECPQDGSIKGLCLNFFQAVDDLLGSSYHKNYAKSRRTVDELILDVARVAAIHCIGVLVIDEIQNLSETKSGGSKKMLNFFVQLINTIGLPVVLVGTYKAWSVLGDEFRQIRRGTGQGDLVWDPIKEDDTWKTFSKSLWRYQYLQNFCPLTPELSHALYYECQGITDFAVKLYMLAQVRAIATGKETITKSIIKSVAKDCLRTARTVLDALKETNPDKSRKMLMKCEDVKPIDLEPFIEEALESLPDEDQLNSTPKAHESSVSCEIEEHSTTELPEQSSNFPEPDPIAAQKNVPTSTEAKPSKKQSKPSNKTCSSQNSLPDIVAEAEKSGKTTYEVLKQKAYIRPATEYIMEEIAI